MHNCLDELEDASGVSLRTGRRMASCHVPEFAPRLVWGAAHLGKLAARRSVKTGAPSGPSFVLIGHRVTFRCEGIWGFYADVRDEAFDVWSFGSSIDRPRSNRVSFAW